MNAQTVAGLVALVRARTDQTNSTAFSDATEITPWVRQSLAQLYEILTSRWLNWYVVRRPITLVNSQEFYTLPPDFRALNDIYLLYSQGLYREKLRMIPANEIGSYTNQSNAWGRWDLRYCLQGNRLYITPIGNVTSTTGQNCLEMWYVPQFTAPVLDYTTISPVLPNGWEEWVVLDVMEKMNVKLRLDLTAVNAMKQEQIARLVSAASVRDGEAPQMVDACVGERGLWTNANVSGPAIWVNSG